MASDRKWSAKQLTAMEMMAAGVMEYRAIAEAVGVRPETISRWQSLDGWSEDLATAAAEHVARLRARLSDRLVGVAAKAIDWYDHCLTPGADPRTYPVPASEVSSAARAVLGKMLPDRAAVEHSGAIGGDAEARRLAEVEARRLVRAALEEEMPTRPRPTADGPA